jgi:hypothetical protein
MGRLKKYQTIEEQKLAQKLASKKYYWNNKEQEDAKSRERYRRNIQDNKP